MSERNAFDSGIRAQKAQSAVLARETSSAAAISSPAAVYTLLISSRFVVSASVYH